jgi:hypothetical protein
VNDVWIKLGLCFIVAVIIIAGIYLSGRGQKPPKE